MGARVVGSPELTYEINTTTSITPRVSSHVTGQYLNLWVFCDNTSDDVGSTAPTSTGGGTWVREANDANVSKSGAFFKLKCTSANETCSAVNFTSAPSSGAICWTTDGATATAANYVDAFAILANSDGGTSLPSARPTPSTSGTLCFVLGASDTGAQPQLEPGLMRIAADDSEGSVMGYYVGWFWHDDTTQVPEFDAYFNRIDDALRITVAIESATGSTSPPRSSLTNVPCTALQHFNDDSTSSYGAPSPWTPALGTLAGETFVARAAGNQDRGIAMYLNNAPNRFIAPNGSNREYNGTGFTFTSFDAAGKNIQIQLGLVQATGMVNLGTIADGGVVVLLGSSASDYRVWKVSGTDADRDIRSPAAYIIDPTNTTDAIEDVGAFNDGAIDRVLVAVFRTGVSGVDVRLFMNHFHLLDTLTIVGGESANPATVDTFREMAESCGLLTVEKQGNGQFKILQDVATGETGADLYFVDSGTAVEMPIGPSGNDLQYQGIPLTYTFLCPTGGTLEHTDSTFSMSNVVFNLHASATSVSLSGNIITATTSITYTNVNLGDLDGVTFRGSVQSSLPAVTGVFNNVTFDNSTDTTGAVVINFATIADLNTAWTRLRSAGTTRFTNNTVAILLNYTGVANLTGTTDDLPANLLSENNPTDILLDDGGFDVALTIGAPTDSGWSTHNTTGGGTSSISFVTPVLALTIESDVTATIRYFDDDLQTPLDSQSTTSLDYEYPDTDPIDIEVVLQGYVPFNRQNVTPSNSTFSVELDFDEAYNSSHGLNIDTEYAYNRSTKVLTLNQDLPALDVRSSLADEIRLDSAYFNTKLLLEAIPGLTRVDQINGLTVADMQYWKGAGSERFDAADSTNPVAKWFAVQSVGFITGAAAYIRQVNSGDATAVTLTSDVVNEAFQYYSDTNHDGTPDYDRSDYAVIKTFLGGYKQGRIDIIANAGVSNLVSNLYVVPLANEEHGYTNIDPGISADITLVAGGTVGGKTFAYEIVDGGTNTAEDIANQLNVNAANNPNAVIPGGTGLRYWELPDMLVFNGSTIETEAGIREGSTPTQVGFYVSRGGSDHPNVARFQADDGTYYVPAVQSTITGSGMTTAVGADRILMLTNTTAESASAWQATTAYSLGDKVLRTTGAGSEQTAGLYFVCVTAGTTSGTEPTWDTVVGNQTNDGTVVWKCCSIIYYAADPNNTNYSDTYINGEEFITGDVVNVKFAELDSGTTYKYFETNVTVTSSGFLFTVDVTSDTVYAFNTKDGSSYTGRFALNLGNEDVKFILDQDYENPELYAYLCYENTQVVGAYHYWRAITADDVANYRINTSVADIKLDVELTNTFVKQKDDDTSRLYRDDGARPALDPVTGSGSGIDPGNWKDKVYGFDIGGSGFTSSDRAVLGALPTLAEFFSRAMGDGTFEEYIQQMYIRADLHSTKPNTYNEEGTQISNDDFTLTTDGNGQVTKS